MWIFKGFTRRAKFILRQCRTGLWVSAALLVPSIPAHAQAWFVPSYLDQNNNADQDCALPANVVESGGFLAITANHVSVAVPCGSANHALSSQTYTAGWAIGNTASLGYGLYVFRAAFPAKTGTWAAAWLATRNCADAYKLTLSPTSPASNCVYESSTYLELDPAETKGGVLDQFLITTSAQGGTLPAIDVTQYHIYAVSIKSTGATFFVDGTNTFTESKSIPTPSLTFLINLTIGGAGGSPSPGDYPQSLSVDYMRKCPDGTALPTTGTPTGGCTQPAATDFDDEFEGSLFQSSVYVGQGFTGNATGLDTGNLFGAVNNVQTSWPNDPGYCTNGQIGPGTTLNFVGTITTTLIANCSGTSGSPITYNFLAGSSGTVNTNGQSFINVVGPPSTAISGAITVSGNVAIH